MEKITQVSTQVVETVTPVINTCIEKTSPVIASAISGAISVVERIDPDAANREAVYGGEASADAAPVEESKASAEAP